VGVVLPQTTREIEVLCHEADNLRRQGIAVAVSSPEAIGLSNNKWKLLQVFEELGLPHPRYFLAREPREVAERAAELGYPARPVVVKPPQSNGMRGFRVLTERPWDVRRFMQEKPDGTEMRLADLLAILRSGSEYPALLVTEYLEGPEYSVDAFAGRAGAVAVPRLRKAIRSGISFETVLEDRRDLIDSTLCAAGRIGLRYAFGFQYKLDAAGTPKVLECNPRIQGTMAAGVFGGVNVIWMALCEAVGRPVVIPTSDLQRASFLRYWGGVGLHADGCDEI
jgi:carbamoyl-phosphate synthase large subunit